MKLQRFELVSLLDESKKLVDFLQLYGCVHLENIVDEHNIKFNRQDFGKVINNAKEKKETAENAVEILEKYCNLKKSVIESLTDYKELRFYEYKELCSNANAMFEKCNEICSLDAKFVETSALLTSKKLLSERYKVWENLDIPMSSSQTSSCSVFIGSVKLKQSKEKILSDISAFTDETCAVDVQIISSSSLQTCIFVICHKSDEEQVKNALAKIGFIKIQSPAKKLVNKAIIDVQDEIVLLEKDLSDLKAQFSEYIANYDNIRFLIDYYSILTDKYYALTKSVNTQKTIYFIGYVPEKNSEELKFEIEKTFTAQFELFDVDFDNYDVPVLLENRSIAKSVENITDMYAHPSNKDIDPNFIMSVFYYLLFGLMLADGGYGILMVIFALVLKFKFKVTGQKKVFADFALYSGISTTFWGALFGGWFGNLIPVMCTEFLGYEREVDLALWFSPQAESVKMMLFSFLLGIIHIFVGLAIRFYNLCKNKNFIGAFCDVIPVYVFVTGFAIIGKDFIEPVSEKAKLYALYALGIGAVLIVLTAGRSAKNILGKLAGGLYGLYSTTTGYLGDILSYARLLALNLVTTVIAMVVNQLAAMPKNVIVFILIFILGHTINLSINLIGTYVHTNRLQYVEFFSKFYEGGGRNFTPLKINAKYFKFKEDTINDRNYE